MASHDRSLSTNNPFRRKSGNPSPAAQDTDSPPATSQPAPRPPFTTFKSAAPEQERRDENEQPVQTKPKKIVKKVRVQSPPPSSPEETTPVTRYPPLNNYRDDDSVDSQDDEPLSDPFNAPMPDADDHVATEPPLPQTPYNPFSKTLQDLERTGDDQDASPKAAGGGKGSIDVNSFKRLLLTGHTNISNQTSASDPSAASQGPARQSAQYSADDAHGEQERQETDEKSSSLPAAPLATVPPAPARKKPPPPSSRHGKLIKIELGADGKPSSTPDTTQPKPNDQVARRSSSQSTISLQSPSLATDVNKPLPPAPTRPSMDGDVDSPFDREAAGKVPEAFAEMQANPKPPTPPPATRQRSGSQNSTQSRKPAPVAPPPRRHGRSNSKAPSINTINSDEDPPRSSMDSTRSRTDSLRNSTSADKPNTAPAPPPPRRPQHSRRTSSYASAGLNSLPTSPDANEHQQSPLGLGTRQSTSGSTSERPGATVTTGKDGVPKLSAPPPPPTRQPSTRRPPSAQSMEVPGHSKKASKEKVGGVAPPPPPPPRLRGASRASNEGVKTEADEPKSDETVPAPSAVNPGGKQGEEILADLDALQREVDALMGKYPKTAGA
ncbi:hypothetical protein F4780DRAFT_44976 [Xylariomycetidae sp. FL0641]|nr:hypothetical protein F4780DRAFT_44976 [Xylariomycetidae sp. FL0641]